MAANDAPARPATAWRSAPTFDDEDGNEDFLS